MKKSAAKRIIVSTIESAIARPSVVSLTPGEFEAAALSPLPVPPPSTASGVEALDFVVVNVAAAQFDHVDDGLADVDAEAVIVKRRISTDDDAVAVKMSVEDGPRLGSGVALAELLAESDGLLDGGDTAAEVLPRED